MVLQLRQLDANEPEKILKDQETHNTRKLYQNQFSYLGVQ